jgi:osmotically inducible protein OsmC
MPTRTAQAKWEGGLKDGRGSFSGSTGLSGQYNFSSRFENGAGSNPEELLAAAEAACFSMALSAALEGNKTPATSVDTKAACTVEKVDDGFSITKMHLDIKAVVPNIDDAAFQKIVAATKEGCPVSKALKGNVDLQATAALVS